ncbi:MAG: peptide MFS transporter [Bacteroidetes bacterium]|nr:peptide MFS transporter [Bacteroidota bacterium]
MSQTQKGHPKGLYVLFATEFWERFSYYGMRAIFALYMTKMLLLDKSEASNIYGSYTGLVYLTPLIGGYVADRYWGNRKSIFVGGLLMAIGQFFMFFSAAASHSSDKAFAITMMWTGLTFLIFGNGFFKPNISTMVGQLYPDGDGRKDAAYTIFYMGINAGAFLAPLVCGYFGEEVDFKWGFFSAGVGMLISLVIFYLLKNKYVVAPDGRQLGVGPNKLMDAAALGGDEETGLSANDKKKASNSGGFSKQQLTILIGGIIAVFSILYWVLHVDVWGSLIYGMTIVGPFVIITDPSLTKIEKDRLWVIILIMIFVIFFWMCFEQAGASLTFFAAEQTNRHVFGWAMPASYFQSFNAGFIVLLAPIISAMWVWFAKKGKEPVAPYKQSMGLMLLAFGYLVIAIGAKNIPEGGASIIFLTGLYFLHTIGELFLSPIGLSMVNKLTPGRFTSLMMGIWFLAVATGNKLAGAMSSLYPEEQKISATYTTKDLTIDGNAIDWNTVMNNQKVNNAIAWKLNLVKKSDKSKEPDSLASITAVSSVAGFTYDSVKTKRIIPAPMSKKELSKLSPGEKEPKFIYALSEDGKNTYLLTNDLKGKNNSVSMQVWDMKPARPKFLSLEIDSLYTYFMIFVGFAGAASVILFLLCARLKKMMHGVH